MTRPARNNKSLALLLRKTAERATGELVVEGGDSEAHVCLQGGKIAWAHNNQERSLFVRHLTGVSGLDEGALRVLLDECQNTQKPVIEVLATWGVREQGLLLWLRPEAKQ
jgi:hypothetical protein